MTSTLVAPESVADRSSDVESEVQVGPARWRVVGGSLVVAALVGTIGAGAYLQGAFYADQARVVAIGVLTSLVLALIVWRRALVVALRSPVGVLAVALLAWLGVAGIAHGTAAIAGAAAVVLATTAVWCIAWALGADERQWLVDGLLGVGVLVAASGVMGIVLRREPWTISDGGLWRAASTITYSNGTAAFLVPLALVALARVVTRPSLAGRLVCLVLLLGIAATLSRAGALALALGALAVAWQAGWIRTAARSLPLVAATVVAGAGVMVSMPHHSTPRPWIAALAGAGGAAVAMVPATRRTLAVGGAVALVGAVAGLTLGGGTMLQEATHAIRIDRLSLESPDRAGEWAVTFDAVVSAPVVGVGPDDLVISFVQPDGDHVVAEYTHNEFLQVAAEFGVPALVLVTGVFIVCGTNVARRREMADPTRVAALGVLVAGAVHASLDFTWHISVIPLLTALLVGVGMAPKPSDRAQAKEHS